MSWWLANRRRAPVDREKVAQDRAVEEKLAHAPFGVPIKDPLESFPSARFIAKQRSAPWLAPEEDRTPLTHTLKKAPPLVGGANDGAASGAASGASNKNVAETGDATEKWITLYGFQGAVMFNIHDKYSLVDAIVRLAAPQPLLNFAFYHISDNNAGKSGGKGAPTITRETHVNIRDQGYCRDKIRRLFAPDGAEAKHALFVYARDEIPPPAKQWQPGPETDTDSSILVRCVRSRFTDRKDVAYLRVPKNASDICYNQYLFWFMTVARILTPGSGLRALRLDDLGVVPHSFVGLHNSVHADVKTHGCAGFSPWSWRELVEGVKTGGRVVVFDVEPLPRDALAVSVPGLNQGVGGGKGEPVVLVRLRDDPADPYGTRNKQAVADLINMLIDAATTADEQKLLKNINIWGSGIFWTDSYVHLDGYPINAHSIDFHTEKKLSSGFVTVRPAYTTYTAHVVDPSDASGKTEQTFQYVLDEALPDFRARIRDAGLDGLNTGCLRISQRDPRSGPSPTTARFRGMAQDDIKRNNRAQLNLLPNANQADWVFICSQIVSPHIWITEAPATSISQGEFLRVGKPKTMTNQA